MTSRNGFLLHLGHKVTALSHRSLTGHGLHFILTGILDFLKFEATHVLQLSL